MRHPLGAIAYATGGRESFLTWKHSFEEQQFYQSVRRLTGASAWAIKHLRSELANSGLEASINEIIEEKGLPRKKIYNYAPYGSFYYLLFRLFKPGIVVETGVWYGVSTAFILQALEHNGTGIVYSIDLPNASYVRQIDSLRWKAAGDSVGDPENTGILVPKALRHRWSLTLGRTQEELPPLLEKVGSIDAFVRDSEHTYGCMMFEFSTAWRFLRPGGILTSDDVDWNDAFRDFAKLHNVRPTIFQRSLGEHMGALVKPAVR